MTRWFDRSLWRLCGRSVKVLSRYMPHFFILLIMHSVVMAIAPYAGLWLLSVITDAVVNGTVVGSMPLVGFTAALAVLAVTLLEAAFRRAKEARWDMLYHAVERLLTDKLLLMDQTTLEDPTIREQLSHIKETIYALGAGLVQIPEIVQNLCHGLFGTVVGLLLSQQFLAVVTMPWITYPLWIGLLVLTVWVSEYARRRREAVSEAVAAADRSYYAFAESAEDPAKAADMRLYGMDGTVMRYLHETEHRFFSVDGLKRTRAHGRKALGGALMSSLPKLWIGFGAAVMFGSAASGTIACGTLIGSFGVWCLLPRDLGLFVSGVRRLQENEPHLRRFFTFLDAPPQMYRGSLTTEKRADCDYEISFRNVSFCYPSQDAAALEDVSVTLKSGSRTAIVGENGGGKSTFIKLLCRMYDPDEGEILLNGIDIRKYRREEYAALISAVFQDACLFPTSVVTNVACTREVDVECVADCLNTAGASEGLLAADSIDTLSHSDKKRVAIARALYKKAPFLLLDEPTVCLDPSEEAALYANLDRMIGERTAVFVSHRLASCRFCDEILVLEGGRLVERGTHEELIAKKGRYHVMWNAQAMAYKTE